MSTEYNVACIPFALAFLVLRNVLFMGADRNVINSKDSLEKLENTNREIVAHRLNFDKDVEVLCKLCELLFGAQGCTPNLHSLHNMIRHLLVVKGHPAFEMIVEHLASEPVSMPFVFHAVDNH
jgi:hypothetical protein